MVSKYVIGVGHPAVFCEFDHLSLLYPTPPELSTLFIHMSLRHLDKNSTDADSGPCNYREFLATLCKFAQYKTIVEIGVLFGQTTLLLCDAAATYGGKVYGYDFFGAIGAYRGFGAAQSKEAVEAKLAQRHTSSLFKITQVDTTKPEFSEMLNKDTGGKIDFAFIDACHSYAGIKNDFLKVYPLLTEDGTIALHDTYSHTGCRKFVLDLYQDLNDGTFDILNLPYGDGNFRCGLTLITKRTYPLYKSGVIIQIHDPTLNPDDIYNAEQEWYKKQLKSTVSASLL